MSKKNKNQTFYDEFATEGLDETPVVEEEENKELASLQHSVKYWENLIKVSHNNVEKAELADRVMEAKKRINEIKAPSTNPKEVHIVKDATPIADRLEKGNSRSIDGTVRGKVIINSNDNFFSF